MQRLLTLLIALGLTACARPTPTCSDGVRNGAESDVDCGGPDCSARCVLSNLCETPEDCQSGVCRLHRCVPPRGTAECLRNSDCPSGACLDGACVFACTPPLEPCGAGCVDLKNDPSNCGACGRACNPNERCENARCEERCPPGTSACGTGPSFSCVDTGADALHCGNCTTICAAAGQCVAGLCMPDCAPFQMTCGVQCVSPMTDVQHCGGCGLPCDPGEVCSMGSCQPGCSPPAVVCDGGLSCVDLRFDPLNCGACGAPCPLPPHAKPLCLNNQCARTACDPGFADCNRLPGDGCEAELAIDPMHCGVCGRACACINGQCP